MTLASVLDHPPPALGSLIRDAVALNDALGARRWPQARVLAQRIAGRAASLRCWAIGSAACQLACALATATPAPGWKLPWSTLVTAIDAALDDVERTRHTDGTAAATATL